MSTLTLKICLKGTKRRYDFRVVLSRCNMPLYTRIVQSNECINLTCLNCCTDVIDVYPLDENINPSHIRIYPTLFNSTQVICFTKTESQSNITVFVRDRNYPRLIIQKGTLTLMPRPYNIDITNGTGTEKVLNGTYEVTGNFPGYDATTLTPKTITVDNETTYAFTIEATGTLTLHVSDGNGTNIVGATLVRTNESGSAIGEVLTTDASGNVNIENVPYGAEIGVPTVYYKQLTSDGNHEFSTAVQNTQLTTPVQTAEIINTPAADRTFTVADANYSLEQVNGTLTLS